MSEYKTLSIILIEAEKVVARGAIVGIVVLETLVNIFLRVPKINQDLDSLRFYKKLFSQSITYDK